MGDRERFIKKLDEVIEFADECGELAAKGTLCVLAGTLEVGSDLRFFNHVMEFSRAEIERLSAAIGEGK